MTDTTTTPSGIRRVAATEVRQRIPCSETWLRHLIAEGLWPTPLRDPGGRRRWWMSSDVDAAILALRERATTTPASKPVLIGAEPRARRTAGSRVRGSSRGTTTSLVNAVLKSGHTTSPTKQHAGVRRGTETPDDGTQRT